MSSSIFKSVKSSRPKRNLFDLSHEVKMSMRMGTLTPIFCEEVVPGDSIRLNTEVMLRFAPMLAPIMHRVNVYTHYFFVPNRIVFADWEKFITGGVEGKDTTPLPVIPVGGVNDGYFFKGGLPDYLGIPVGVSNPNQVISALPFRAYQEIYNEYYRDQTLHERIDYSKGSVIDSVDEKEFDKLLTLRNRCWEKDYFTSALPFAQRGEAVSVPLGDSAPVVFDRRTDRQPFYRRYDPVGGNWVYAGEGPADFGESSAGQSGALRDPTKLATQYDPNGTLHADLTEATGMNINDLRRSIRLQEWLEKNARAGSRYIEQIFSHFGVKSSDSRLQRPEYLGGGKSPVTISEVLQMSATQSNSPQANMAGHGIAVGNSHSFKKFFEEHGYVIGIMSILPRTAYQQGINRKFQKFDRFDYFWPEFAHLGEQPIKNSELYFSKNQSLNEGTFGYTPRYAEYKHVESRVAGEFRDTLSFWHMGRIFNPDPSIGVPLNGDFVAAVPTTRIFAVENAPDQIYCHLYHNYRAIRPMPKFGTPTI